MLSFVGCRLGWGEGGGAVRRCPALLITKKKINRKNGSFILFLFLLFPPPPHTHTHMKERKKESKTTTQRIMGYIH